MSADERAQRPIWLGQDKRGWDHARIHRQLLDDDRLGVYEIGVYVGLAIHAEAFRGVCFPAESTLAGYLRCGERRVRDALHTLATTGYIEIERRVGKASTYHLLPPPSTAPAAGVRSDPGTERRTTPAPRADEQEPVNENSSSYSPSAPKPPPEQQQRGSAEPDPVRSGMARIDRSLRDLCPPEKNAIYGPKRDRLKALLVEGADVELALAAIRQGAPAEGAPLRADRAIDAMERGAVPQGDRPPYRKPYVAEEVVIDEDEFARGKARIAEAQAARPDRKREAS